MRGNIINSTFRRVSSGYLCKPNKLGPLPVAKRFGWSKRGVASSEDTNIRKLVQDDFVCPVKYFKEEIGLLESLDDNELLSLGGGARGRSFVAWKAGRIIRSLPELIAEHHARGNSVGLALRVDNLRVSRSKGKIGFMDTSAIGPAESGSLRKDWRLGGDVLLRIAKMVLGDTPLPKELSDYISLMQSISPKKFRLLFYNTLFFSPRARYWLKVFVDQRFRKDAESLPRDTKKLINTFMGKLPHYGEKDDEGSLLWLAEQYEVICGAMGESRINAQVRRRAEERKHIHNMNEEDALKEEDKWKKDSGRWVVSVNRDVVTHGTKTKKKYLKKVEKHMLTAENIWQMLQVEFSDYDQKCIELCDEEEVLWVILGIEEIFFETPDTWKKALEALQKDFDGAEDLASEK